MTETSLSPEQLAGAKAEAEKNAAYRVCVCGHYKKSACVSCGQCFALLSEELKREITDLKGFTQLDNDHPLMIRVRENLKDRVGYLDKCIAGIDYPSKLPNETDHERFDRLNRLVNDKVFLRREDYLFIREKRTGYNNSYRKICAQRSAMNSILNSGVQTVGGAFSKNG